MHYVPKCVNYRCFTWSIFRTPFNRKNTLQNLVFPKTNAGCWFSNYSSSAFYRSSPQWPSERGIVPSHYRMSNKRWHDSYMQNVVGFYSNKCSPYWNYLSLSFEKTINHLIYHFLKVLSITRFNTDFCLKIFFLLNVDTHCFISSKTVLWWQKQWKG